MAFKNYDELKRFFDGQARSGLLPLAGLTGKPLDGKQLAGLQQAQLEAARDALKTAQRDRERALEWHDAALERAKARIDALETAFKGVTKPSAPPKKKPPAKKTAVPAKKARKGPR